MWVQLPDDDDARRQEVRRWLEGNPDVSPQSLAERGYVAPNWPRPWGLDADPVLQLIIDEELRRAGVKRPNNPIGLGWAGPTLLHAGTEEQKERFLPGILTGEDFWCQLFSEPEAGSDLASLGTRAVRDGRDYVVTGHKVWASLAHKADYGILLARTDPDATKQRGISYFVCPMDAPGVTVEPIREITGVEMFTEVFLDQVRIPVENLVGEENGGWELARITLSNERVSISRGGVLFGLGPTARDLVNYVRDEHGPVAPEIAQRLMGVYIEGELLRLTRMRLLAARVQGDRPGPEGSVGKVFGDRHGQRLMNLARDIAGLEGLLADAGRMGDADKAWSYGYLASKALTIGGGTYEIQMNIIAEKVLGLPRDSDLDSEAPWRESQVDRSWEDS